jgi:hypothetical protein
MDASCCFQSIRLASVFLAFLLCLFQPVRVHAQPLTIFQSKEILDSIRDQPYSENQSRNIPFLFTEANAAVRTSSDSLNRTRLWLITGTLAAANAGIMVYYFSTFYQSHVAERSSFHSFNDWYNSDLNIDKCGHIWGTQAYERTLFRMFRWTNISEDAAMIWSGSVAWLFQLQMEITDGFYRQWGFSWSDMGANTFGALYPIVQRKIPFFRSVNFKMSYHPSYAVKQDWVEHSYLRDYDGFTYWLSFSIHDFLPEAVSKYYPAWLCLAVGYGGENTMLGKNHYNSGPGNKGLGNQEWYLALDIDLRKLPGDTPFLRALKEDLNVTHLPLPAVRFTPGTIWYGFYF